MIKNKSNVGKICFYVFVGLIFAFATFYRYFIDWATTTFVVTLKEILYTILSPMKGADTDFLDKAVENCMSPTLIAFFVWGVYAIIDSQLTRTLSVCFCIKLKQKTLSFNVFKVIKVIIVLLLIVSLVSTTMVAEKAFRIGDYISSYIKQTIIYEDYYVAPDSVDIKSPSNYKNLIYIYLESMETTYASTDVGGFQSEVNYMPNLTNMADEYISFSSGDKLGGFKCLSGTTWTMGSLFATTTGVPFSFPVSANDMDQRNSFAKGITSLGDILNENGYAQQFLCGSDGDFAGRKTYFTQHGNYNVFDIYSAKEKGYIPEDYFVWWGYEDLHLYEIAKQELTEISKDTSRPFNFTMLTVDTHHVDGYVCANCSSEYETQLKNVVTCADSQIYNFIEWGKQQPFYENTVIIITGDHPRMDSTLVGEVEFLDRTLYNCFINTDKSNEELNLKNRTFTTMDIFPTVLSALNFEISGDKLGLGTDMFSGEETLAEKIGIETLESEINKYSKYYIDNFS